MNKYALCALLGMGMTLTACSQMPSECEESWDKIEKMAKESGIPDDALKSQKKEFEAQIKSMSKDQAIESCKTQNSFLGLIK